MLTECLGSTRVLGHDLMNTYYAGGSLQIPALSGILLLFSLLLPSFFPAEASSIILLAILLLLFVLSGFKVEKKYLVLVAPLFVLLLLGSTGIFLYPPIEVAKDVWYVSKAMVVIGTGFFLARHLSHLTSVLRIVVAAGVIAAMIHFIQILHFGQSEISIFDLRKEENVKGYFITIVALSMLLSLPRRLLGLKRYAFYAAFILCALSFLVSFSRTHIVTLIIVATILRGWARVNPRNMAKIAVTVVSLALLAVWIAQRENSADITFMRKTINSFQELQIRDYSEQREINLNWRGFESHRAWLDFLSATTYQQVFGQGFGSTVDLGFYMKLGESEFRHIPHLHNGYMLVLVKFGLLGLLVYVYFLMTIIWRISYFSRARSSNTDQIIIVRSIAAMGWVLLLTSFVIAGVFNKSSMLPILILLGLFVGLERMQKLERVCELSGERVKSKRIST